MIYLFVKSFALRSSIVLVVFLLTIASLEAKEPRTIDVESNNALKPVRGFVVDEFGEPMVGVVVNALGSLKSAITDTEGKYTLLACKDDILKFSQIGIEDKEEKITSSRIVNVELAIVE